MTTYTFLYDNPELDKLREIQQRVAGLKMNGVLAAVQRGQEILSRIAAPARVTESMNSLIQSWSSPQMVDMLLAAQRLADELAPVTQRLMEEQSWITSIIPSIDTSLRDAVAFSYSDLTCGLKKTAILSVIQELEDVRGSESIRGVEVPQITDSEKKQLAEDLAEAVRDTPNWQQRLMDKLQEWKKRNPVLAVILTVIISQLFITYIVEPAIMWVGQTIKAAVVREEPNTGASTIYQLEAAHGVVVVDDVPYYYLIEFDDPETNEHVCGYISKQSVKPVSVASGDVSELDADAEEASIILE